MATIQKQIDYVRQALKETSDDTEFSDLFIYDTLLLSRNILIKRELDKKKELEEYMWVKKCIPLCVDTWHDCDCVPDLGCQILKSKYPLPQYFRIRITNLTGNERYAEELPDIGKYRKYRRTLKLKPWWALSNQHVHVFGVPQNKWRLVLVSMIAVDPLLWAQTPTCTADGAEVNCDDPLEDEFTMPAGLDEALIQMTLSKILPSAQLGEDNTNNADSDIIGNGARQTK